MTCHSRDFLTLTEEFNFKSIHSFLGLKSINCNFTPLFYLTLLILSNENTPSLSSSPFWFFGAEFINCSFNCICSMHFIVFLFGYSKQSYMHVTWQETWTMPKAGIQNNICFYNSILGLCNANSCHCLTNNIKT